MVFNSNELILDTEDYNFTLFEHQGFGGKRKYIATPKKSGLPKLLVKHKGEFAPPCNSFIYGRLAQLLGMNVPNTYMMNLSINNADLFDSTCVVGIEFIEGLTALNMDDIKSNESLKKQFIHCFILCGLFTQFEDSMQCAYLPGKAVIPLDYDDSFGLEYPTFNAALRGNEMDELIIKYQLENAWRHNLDIYLKICIEMSAEQLGISTEESTHEFITVLERFCELKDEEISSITNVLLEFFPPLLAAYYEEYITILQSKTIFYIRKIIS